MKTKITRQKIKSVFWIIAGVAIAGVSYSTIFLRLLFPDIKQMLMISGFVIFPLLIEGTGAVGLARNWFNSPIIRPGRVVNILQWVAGILGAVAIFDSVIRLLRRSPWMRSTATLTLDGILILLFVLWMVASYLINKDAKERKICEFC